MEIVKALIRAGAHKASNDGYTSLWIAASPNHIDMVRVLVNVKAKLDKVDMNGASPRGIAASPNHLEMMGKLLPNVLLLKTDSNF